MKPFFFPVNSDIYYTFELFAYNFILIKNSHILVYYIILLIIIIVLISFLLLSILHFAIHLCMQQNTEKS